eukprot:539917_1
MSSSRRPKSNRRPVHSVEQIRKRIDELLVQYDKMNVTVNYEYDDDLTVNGYIHIYCILECPTVIRNIILFYYSQNTTHKSITLLMTQWKGKENALLQELCDKYNERYVEIPPTMLKETWSIGHKVKRSTPNCIVRKIKSRLDKTVLELKIFSKQININMLQFEINILRQMNHHNVMKLHDIFQSTSSSCYLVFDACAERLEDFLYNIDSINPCTEMKKGSYVIFRNLERCAYWNGQVGKVIQYNEKKERWKVEPLVLSAPISGRRFFALHERNVELLQSKSISWIERFSKMCFKQIVLGLAHIHNKRIVHRKITPKNIIFSQTDRQIKITSFSSAAICQPDVLLTEICYTQGTDDELFVAPEVVIGKGYDTKADMWSAGIILYNMLCGCNPFTIPNQTSLLSMEHMDHISIEAKNLVMELLERDPILRLTAKEALKHAWL